MVTVHITVFKGIQPLTLCLYLFVQNIHAALINTGPLIPLNETSLTSDYKLLNQGNTKHSALSSDGSRQKLLQSLLPSPSIFSETFSHQKLFTIKLVLVFGFSIEQLFPNDTALFDSFIRPTMFNLNWQFEKLGISVILVDYLRMSFEAQELDAGFFNIYRVSLEEKEQYANSTFFLVRAQTEWTTFFPSSICTESQSNLHKEIVIDNTNLSASIIAHEIGINIGFAVDVEGCNCEAAKCIMNETVGQSPVADGWSSCSINKLNDLFIAGELDCLLGPPKINETYCGNGIIEGNETCDCGSTECGPCCYGSNCTLTPNADCGSGPCCDTTSCKPLSASELCRNSLDECDLPEYCDGKSAQCPENLHKHDGTLCDNNSKAYCYHGKCRSKSLMCKSMFSVPFGVGNEICYAQNAQGTVDSNCGFEMVNEIETPIPCNASNIECGKLFCYGPMGANLRTSAYTFTTNSLDIHNCSSISFMEDNDLKPLRDLRFVADGSPCSVQSICIDKACKPLSVVESINRCPSDCSGNGICDNLGQCHCNQGFLLPDCATSTFTNNNGLSTVFVITAMALFVFFAVYIYRTKFAPREISQLGNLVKNSLTNTSSKTDTVANQSALPIQTAIGTTNPGNPEVIQISDSKQTNVGKQ